MRILIFAVIALVAIGIASGQDFVKGTQKGGPVELSGLSGDIFEGAFFQSDGWYMDMTSYGLTSSQAAFLKDDAKDGKPAGNVTGKQPLRCGRGLA